MKRVVACLVLAVAVAGCGGEDGESFDCEALGAQLDRLERQLDDLKADAEYEEGVQRAYEGFVESGYAEEPRNPEILEAIEAEIEPLESDVRLIEADFRAYGCT